MGLNYAALWRNVPEQYNNTEEDCGWFVEKIGKIITVRFDYSKSFTDWKNNLDWFPEKEEAFSGADYKVHKGFKRAYYSARNQVLDKCYEIYEDGDAFRIVGWSLAAAMANLAAEDIGWHFNTKVELITYGSPKVYFDKKGLESQKEYLAENSVQWNYGADLVTHVPPFAKKNNFDLHIGPKFSIFRLLKCGIADHFPYQNENSYEY